MLNGYWCTQVLMPIPSTLSPCILCQSCPFPSVFYSTHLSHRHIYYGGFTLRKNLQRANHK